MARTTNDTFASRLRRLSEEALSTLFDEFKTNRGLRRRFEHAGERLRDNRGLFDRNLEILLDLANLPSKRDIRELRDRVEHLTGQVVNLNLKLDRLLNRPADGWPAGTPHRGRHRTATTRGKASDVETGRTSVAHE
jgi:polyhydroxyalkanoate synthesis regulator phasin